MKVVFIGNDPKTAEMATLSLHLRWPEVSPIIVPTATQGLDVIGQVSPELVLMKPDFNDMSLAEVIQELRRFW